MLRMLGRIFTVGGYTLLLRLTAFARDIMLAAILGAGPAAEAFFAALRLSNYFRAIFAPLAAVCALRRSRPREI
jgi:putative peptidoglycan lipid II flippase